MTPTLRAVKDIRFHVMGVRMNLNQSGMENNLASHFASTTTISTATVAEKRCLIAPSATSSSAPRDNIWLLNSYH